MLSLSRDLEGVARQFIRDTNPSAYRVVTIDTEDGEAPILKGATDSKAGFRTVTATDGTQSRIKVKGRTIEPLRAASGITQGHVSSFKATLKRETGVTLTTEAADAMLMEMQYRDLPAIKTPAERKEQARDRKARQRAKAKEKGFCTICCCRVAAFNEAGESLATCQECLDRIAESRRQTKANRTL